MLCYTVLAQVFKDTRSRDADPGADFTEEEKLAWRSRSMDFFAEAPLTQKEKKKKDGKKLFAMPRQGSLDFLRAVQNALQGIGVNMSIFDIRPPSAAPASEVQPGPASSISATPPVLSICMDQDHGQWGALHFLQFKKGMNIVGLRDPFHRAWNDMGLALRKAGAWPSYLNSLFVFNISYGPWQNAAFFRDLQNSAADIGQLLDADDPLLLRLWPDVVLDQMGGQDSSVMDASSREMREHFLKEFVHDKSFSVKGPKVSVSRWFSWMKAQTFWDKHWHTKALAIIHIAMHQGWSSSAAGFWEHPQMTPRQALQEQASSSTGPSAANKAKAGFNALRTKSHNTLHAVGRLMIDKELVSMTRMIAMAANPEYTYFSKMQRELKGPGASLEFSCTWALWGWLPTLVQTAGALCDLEGMERAGFTVNFTALHTSLGIMSPAVAWQDSLATSLARLVTGIVAERAGSMVWHTSFYPGRLAGIFNEEASVGIMEELKVCTGAWRAAQQQAGPILKKMVQRSPFGTTYMKWVVVIAEQGGWQCTNMLKELVAAVFSGIGQSKIIEDNNQRLRDRETRDNSSKEVAHLAIWQTPVVNNLLGQYGFSEVQAPTVVTQAPASMEHLFNPTASAKKRKRRELGEPESECTEPGDPEDAMKESFKEITGRQDWVTCNPKSLQNHISDMVFMQWCHQNDGCWHLAASAWKAQLAPEGHLLAEKATSTVFIIIKALEHAFLAWPAKRLTEKFWTLEKVKKLQWKTMVDFDTFKVVPTRFVSPLHLFASGQKEIPQVVWKVVGKPQPLLTHHARNGFAHISEGVMQKVYIDKGWEEPPVARGDADRRQEIALGLMSKIEPETTQEAALEAIRRAHLLAHPDAGCELQINQEMLRDVVLAGEQAKFVDFMKDAEAAQAKAEKRHKQARVAVARHFTKKQAGAARGGRRAAPRWQAREGERVEEVLGFITSHAPAVGSIHPDASNGRWFLVHPLLGRKSISWSERGHSLAAGMCLHQLWSWHMEASGGDPPFQLASLLPVGPAAGCLQQAE
jgi:hypothetical protein